MKRTAAAALALAVAGLSACSGGGAITSSTQSSPATPAEETTTAAVITPDELGDQIGTLYLAVYPDVIALLADRPDAATAATQLAALKEQYVQQFLAFGHQREAMSEADRVTVDARVLLAVNSLPDDTYDAYRQAWTDYSSDTAVAELLASFNIIGQYANFDLLREQAPEEAARLGVG